MSDAYANNVATITCGGRSLRVLDSGTRIEVGDQSFALGEDRPTLSIPAHGAASIIRHESLRPPGPLDGRSFAVTCSAGAQHAQDRVEFVHGRLAMRSFGMLCEGLSYHTAGDPTQVQVMAQAAASESLSYGITVHASIHTGRLSGHVEVGDGAQVIFAFDVEGPEIACALPLPGSRVMSATAP